MIEEEIRICLTGGATGGHFFPLVFVARELKKIAQEKKLPLKIFYLGSKPFNEELLKNEDIEVHLLPQVKLRKYFSFKNFVDILKFPFNFVLAFFYLFKFLPNIIFSKGGPGSLGVVLAGWILRIPIVIHESDALPGLTNRISSFFAKKIFLAFQEATPYFSNKKVEVVGQPVDIDMIQEPAILEDYKRYGLDPHRKVILIIGGSQGSQFLNDLVVDSLPDLLDLAQVVHITGAKHFKDTYLRAQTVLKTKKPQKINDYHGFHSLPNEEIIYLMKIADLIISRAGSSSIFEIAAVQKPSILIPIDKNTAGLHQSLNATIYFKYNACLILEEKNATPHMLLTAVKKILQNKELIEKMKNGAKNFAKIFASRQIAEYLIKEVSQ